MSIMRAIGTVVCIYAGYKVGKVVGRTQLQLEQQKQKQLEQQRQQQREQ